MASSKKKKSGNTRQKVNPDKTAFHAVLQVEYKNLPESSWKSEFGELKEIKSLNPLCQLFRDPKEVKKLKVEDIKQVIEPIADKESLDELMKSECILHRACFAPFEVFEYLISLEIDPKPLDEIKQTPLHFAAYLNKEKIIKLLLSIETSEKCYDGNEITVNKHTPVHYAIFSENAEILKILQNHGCKMQEMDRENRTPLKLAIHFEKPAAVKFLLDCDGHNLDYTTMLKLLCKFPSIVALKLCEDPFCTVDNMKGTIKYNFSKLFPEKEREKTKFLPTPLLIVVINKLLCVVETDTFQEYINIQWKEFGRKFAFGNFLLFLLHVVLWTTLGIFDSDTTNNTLHVSFLVAAVIGTILYMIFEWKQHSASDQYSTLLETFSYHEFDKPEDNLFYHEKTKTLISKMNPKGFSYFNQKWNFIDIVSIIIQWVTVVIEIMALNNVAYSISIRNYIMCANLTLLWICLLKTLRPFTSTGTLVISLSNVVEKDLFRFSIMFLIFLLPMSFNFWITFGGKKIINNQTIAVDYYDAFPTVFFSVLRMAVVDEYDYDNMKKIEPLFTEILITFWLAVSAILLVNLFIALLTDTFQRVYDNTNITIAMEKARHLLGAWHTIEQHDKFAKMFIISKKQFLEKYEKENSLTYSQDDFIGYRKFQNISKNTKDTSKEEDSLKEYFHIHENVLKDTFYLKDVIKKILKKCKTAKSREKEDFQLDSQKSAAKKSVLEQNIDIMKEDLKTLLQHLKNKDSRSQETTPSTSIS